jgi:2-isopropylmalate synthase
MTVTQKLEYFNILVNMGFKEIEIWFPSASQEDYDFTRLLIEWNYIPDDVKIWVLVPARKELIEKTKKSLKWAKNVIVHLYNSTSEVQREIVFKKNKEEITKLATDWVKNIKESFDDFEGNLFFEYSPESFTWTELEFAKDISNAVLDEWWDFKENPVIINLPATIENSTPDVYADEIEYMCREIKDKRTVNEKVNVIISVHTHNDRWTWIAATELAIKAWADRVEWVLLWNWERTWNVPIDVVALNIASQWISPELDLSEWWENSKIISELTNMPIPDRYPYIWKFVNLAFSGSHQDAIKKCFDYCKDKAWKWINAYLPFDPKDIWLEYEPIKVNSQSWKWWVAYILQQNWYDLPKSIQPFIWNKVQKITDEKGWTLEETEIVKMFEEEFINNIWDIDYSDFNENNFSWNWIIEKFSKYISEKLNINFKIKDYIQKSLNEWRDSEAISYFVLEIDWKECAWVWKDSDTLESNKKAIVSALNIYMN